MVDIEIIDEYVFVSIVNEQPITSLNLDGCEAIKETANNLDRDIPRMGLR